MTTVPSSLAGKRIWVAGHRGMLGRALVARLQRDGVDAVCATREELDLVDARAVDAFLRAERPDAAIIAAARVGGVAAYREAPATYFGTNLAIATNCIASAARHGVGKLVYVASAAAYPEHAAQPITPSSLMTGPLDPHHEAYALAKLAGIAMCRFYRQQDGVDFVSVMPTNLYGPGGHAGVQTGHVIPALMRRFHVARETNAPELAVWGTGKAQRQFLHVSDCADALLLALARYSGDAPLNIAGDEEVTIAALAQKIASVVGYRGRIVFDPQKPEGAGRRALDAGELASLGWKPTIGLEDGLTALYRTDFA